MLKQCLLVLLATGLISIAVPFAVARSSSDSPPNNQQSPPSEDNGRWRQGPPDPARRTQELNKKLNLTSDQQAKVQDILQSEHSQMENLRQDTSTPGKIATPK